MDAKEFVLATEPAATEAAAAQSVPVQKTKKNKQQQQQSAKSVPHRDIYARLSFLCQGAQRMSQSSELEPLGRIYAHTMKSIAKKSVLRMYVNPTNAFS